jgi:RNA polymerase sigma factor for flagellar operon FliA
MVASVALYESVQLNNRDDLIVAHMGMVKRVALHLKARLPPFMEVDELVQVGMLGLIEAARGFDVSKGIEFENYAYSRVRGAIIDEVRRLSALPRSAVSFNKQHSAATQVLASELGRTPTQAEMAQHMGMEMNDFQKERGHAKRFETYSMEVVNDEVMNMAGETHRQPEAIVEHNQFMGAVTHAIEDLPEREQLIMQLYYVEELNLKEIGEVLEVSESRVSQILTATVKKLRTSLNITGNSTS